MTALEQSISPLMREAIRTLRQQWFSVDVERVEGDNVFVMVQPTKEDEPRPRVMWEDPANGNVFHQSRTKINGHYGPTLMVGEDRYKPDAPSPPQRATRRYTRRVLEQASQRRLTESPSLWMRRAEINNRLTIANQAFSHEPSRTNLIVIQAARTAMNMIDEQIADEWCSSD